MSQATITGPWLTSGFLQINKDDYDEQGNIKSWSSIPIDWSKAQIKVQEIFNRPSRQYISRPVFRFVPSAQWLGPFNSSEEASREAWSQPGEVTGIEVSLLKDSYKPKDILPNLLRHDTGQVE